MTHRWSARVSHAVALTCAGAVVAAVAIVSVPRTADADTYPGLSDIAAARAAVSDAQAGVAELDAAIVSLEAARAQAENAALFAADTYAEAKDTSETAQRQSVAATARAGDAAEAFDDARGDLAAVAMEAYRSGGSFTSLEAIIGADGFDDVIGRSEDYDRAAAEVDSVVQQVRASEVVAGTMSDFAAQAAQEAADAADAAAVALSAAQDAQRSAEQAVADAETTRDEAVARLAQLQQTSVQLEEQRQQGLAAQRANAQQAALVAALAAAEREAAAAAAAEAAAQEEAANGGGAAPPATTPPAETTPPATTPPTESTGSWSSSAAQGQAAANYAQSLVGSPYQLGGNGPAYDCSGLSSAAWRSVGYSISRSSRSQYATVAHVTFSQLRPGDLIFWGTNRNANSIYHVAVYIGNGQVAEATVPGSNAKIRSYANWNVNDIMPYAGRP